MPRSVFLLLCLLAAPAGAQELGERVRPAEEMIPGLNLAPGQDDLQAAIAAADHHPLGSAENPVRVGGPAGERAFLSRLRCPDGSAPQIGARAEGGVGGFGSILRSYPLACGAATNHIRFDIYHEEHREDRSPPGFTLLPRQPAST